MKAIQPLDPEGLKKYMESQGGTAPATANVDVHKIYQAPDALTLRHPDALPQPAEPQIPGAPPMPAAPQPAPTPVPPPLPAAPAAPAPNPYPMPTHGAAAAAPPPQPPMLEETGHIPRVSQRDPSLRTFCIALMVFSGAELAYIVYSLWQLQTLYNSLRDTSSTIFYSIGWRAALIYGLPILLAAYLLYGKRVSSVRAVLLVIAILAGLSVATSIQSLLHTPTPLGVTTILFTAGFGIWAWSIYKDLDGLSEQTR